MPAFTSITIADNTPTNRTYAPISKDGIFSYLADKTTQTLKAGQSVLRLGYSPSSARRATERVTVDLSLPKVATDANSLQYVDSIGRFKGEFIIPDSWTATERLHFSALVKNALANASVKGYVDTGDAFY